MAHDSKEAVRKRVQRFRAKRRVEKSVVPKVPNKRHITGGYGLAELDQIGAHNAGRGRAAPGSKPAYLGRVDDDPMVMLVHGLACADDANKEFWAWFESTCRDWFETKVLQGLLRLSKCPKFTSEQKAVAARVWASEQWHLEMAKEHPAWLDE